MHLNLTIKRLFLQLGGGCEDLKCRIHKYENIKILLKALIQTCNNFSQVPMLRKVATVIQGTNE